MRFTLDHVPLLLLVDLPLMAAGYGFGILKVLLWLTAIFLLRSAILLYRIHTRKKAEGRANDDYILETIPPSHYVEKVRWIMDYLDIEYAEEQDCGIIGVLLLSRKVPSLRVPTKNIVLQNSPDILRYLYGVTYGKDGPSSERVRRFLEPTEEALAWERKFDTLGDNIRRYVYKTSFDLPESESFMGRAWGLHQEQIPSWQKFILTTAMPVLKAYVSKFADTSPEQVQKAKDDIKKTMKEVDDHLLSDGGRSFILGTAEPTYVDLTFAAMAAFLFFPENFGGKALDEKSKFSMKELATIKGLENVVSESKEFAKQPSGKLVLRLFDQYRFKKITSDN